MPLKRVFTRTKRDIRYSSSAWALLNACYMYYCMLLTISSHEVWSFKKQQISSNSSNYLVASASPVGIYPVSRLPDNALCNMPITNFLHTVPRSSLVITNQPKIGRGRTKRQTIIFYFSFRVIKKCIYTQILTHICIMSIPSRRQPGMFLWRMSSISHGMNGINILETCLHTEAHSSRWLGRYLLMLWTLQC